MPKQYEDKGLREQMEALGYVPSKYGTYFCKVEDGYPSGMMEDVVGVKSAKAFMQLITQKQLEARIDELKDLRALHTRTYTQTVTDNMGNEYVNNSHLYISSYETQERIAKLEDELKKGLQE